MSDPISRQQVIDEIVTWTVEDRPDVEMPTDLIDRIRALPSAQKTGKWQKYEGRFDYNWECSECECSSYEKTSYCAHCGARME